VSQTPTHSTSSSRSFRATRALGVGARVALILGALSVPLHGMAQGQGAVRAPGQYIVVLKDNAADPAAEADRLARVHGLGLGHVYGAALKGFAATVPAARLRALVQDPGVQYVEPDQTVSADTQTLPRGIDRAEADQSSTRAGDGVGTVAVTVAVIDTGIQFDHPDLSVDRVNSKSFVRRNKTANDDNGHGTHVAGTIGALDNGVGVVGVAPGARLWAVKVLDEQGNGYTSDVIKGVDYVTANAGKVAVANMSLGGGYSQSLNDAVARATNAGVVFVAAAGNSAVEVSRTSPASAPSAITVAALADSDGQPGGAGAGTGYGPDDSFATFSNFGAGVDIIAPGVAVTSTWPGGGYHTISGTSMAAPHVSGAAALYIVGHTRDVNRDGLVDGRDVQALRDALVAATVESIPGRYDSRTYPLLNTLPF